jgi:hypothetical protein
MKQDNQDIQMDVFLQDMNPETVMQFGKACQLLQGNQSDQEGL